MASPQPMRIPESESIGGHALYTEVSSSCVHSTQRTGSGVCRAGLVSCIRKEACAHRRPGGRPIDAGGSGRIGCHSRTAHEERGMRLLSAASWRLNVCAAERCSHEKNEGYPDTVHAAAVKHVAPSGEDAHANHRTSLDAPMQRPEPRRKHEKPADICQRASGIDRC